MDGRLTAGAFRRPPRPRHARGRLHRLSDLSAIAICAVACGTDGWVAVEHFARVKKKWFAPFLDLGGGVPSHDTFGRVFAAMNSDAFERCFLAWTKALGGSAGGKFVAIDGKSLRRNFAHAWDRSGMAHLVRANCRIAETMKGHSTDAKAKRPDKHAGS